MPDQAARSRSGTDLAIYNDVRASLRPASDLPIVFRQTDALNWPQFRIGEGVGQPVNDGQFPTGLGASCPASRSPT